MTGPIYLGYYDKDASARSFPASEIFTHHIFTRTKHSIFLFLHFQRDEVV